MKKAPLSSRIERNYKLQLTEIAESKGISESSLVRKILVEHLDRSNEVEILRYEIGALKEQLTEFRETFTRATEAILLAKTHRLNSEQVRDWVRLHIQH